MRAVEAVQQLHGGGGQAGVEHGAMGELGEPFAGGRVQRGAPWRSPACAGGDGGGEVAAGHGVEGEREVVRAEHRHRLADSGA
jgi:hypothetical protein